MGSGTYQVKSNQQVFFRSGRLDRMESTVPDDCGCPPPQIPVMRAAAAPAISEKDLPPTVHLAQPGDEAKPVPPPDPASKMASQDASPSQVTLAVAPPGTESLPAPSPNAPHAQIDAPFVFRASDSPPATAPDLGTGTLTMSRTAAPAPVITIVEPTEQPRKGVMGKVKGFFASIFK
jgi:hypothetical protein